MQSAALRRPSLLHSAFHGRHLRHVRHAFPGLGLAWAHGSTVTCAHAAVTCAHVVSGHLRPRTPSLVPTSAPQRVRGGREGEGGHDNDLVSRGQHDHIQSPTWPTRPVTRPTTGEKGGGRESGGGRVTRQATGERGQRGGEGWDDNDLVSTRQHDHIRGREGEGGGDDNDLVSRGQHDHIQSPAPQRVRGGGRGETCFARPARPRPVTRPATRGGREGEGG